MCILLFQIIPINIITQYVQRKLLTLCRFQIFQIFLISEVIIISISYLSLSHSHHYSLGYSPLQVLAQVLLFPLPSLGPGHVDHVAYYTEDNKSSNSKTSLSSLSSLPLSVLINVLILKVSPSFKSISIFSLLFIFIKLPLSSSYSEVGTHLSNKLLF